MWCGLAIVTKNLWKKELNRVEPFCPQLWLRAFPSAGLCSSTRSSWLRRRLLTSRRRRPSSLHRWTTAPEQRSSEASSGRSGVSRTVHGTNVLVDGWYHFILIWDEYKHCQWIGHVCCSFNDSRSFPPSVCDALLNGQMGIISYNLLTGSSLDKLVEQWKDQWIM